MSTLPILYTFRRCPYAMRARLAVLSSGQKVALREILLRDKAPEFLETSPSATVPCLKQGDMVLDESLDIMKWALGRNDPAHWLDMPNEGHDLVDQADGPFKDALDRTKYSTRYDSDPEAERAKAHAFITRLDSMIGADAWLFGRPTLADMAILPFIRQFAFVDKPRFDAQDWHGVHRWLAAFLASDAFATIMPKYPVWVAGDPTTVFP